MKHPLTLKDIAREMRLSVSTISRALRDDPMIGAETREKIKQYASAHHYKPNYLAANLRKRESNVIGVIIPTISNTFFASVIDGMESVAEKKNFTIIITQSNEEYEREVKCVHSLISARVSGILVSLAKETYDYTHFQEIIANHIPLVFFDRICTGILTDKVVATDYKGAYDAVSYLIKTGCRRIAFYGSDPHLEIAKNRKNGYLDALKAHRIPVDAELIYFCDTSEQAKILTPDVLRMPDPPDAFLAINDLTAAGVLFAVKRANMRIPEDISICGFADGYISQNTDPTLTSVDQHPFEIGKVAMELMIRKIKHPDQSGTPANRIINTSLILRQSTKPIDNSSKESGEE